METTDPARRTIESVARFVHDPLGHALFAYRWGEGLLSGVSGPRAWQREVMETIGAHLSDPATRHMPCRIARASGHGIGKSALIAMLIKWGLDTGIDTRIVTTANTETQLLTKTAPEIAKWHKLSITQDWFRVTASSLVSTTPGHELSWRSDLVTWSVANTEAFAGLHNQGKRIILIFDEASGIAPKVWEVALGALTDEETEIIFLAFGNPTHNTGPFRECFGRHRHLWHARQIDSRTVEGVNRAYLDELVSTYGEDSDLVRVRVRGQFPSASSMQFIGHDLVDAARARELFGGVTWDPVIFGLDCARFGDDHSTLAIRCGRDARTRPWKRWQGVDAMTLAGDVALQVQGFHPDAIFVDAGNIGAAVIDRLRQLGVPNVYEVWFGGKGREAIWAGEMRVQCANKRSEMWTNMRGWLSGGAIPDEEMLAADLTGVEYGYSADQVSILLEKKEHMKARGLASPDDADALALTFAEPVMPQNPAWLDPGRYRVEREETDEEAHARIYAVLNEPFPY
ncbi:MAG: terminase [Sphingomonas bacterium]|uniref:terminase n=1 Tax=Sphingomonas bacterium TaxID=1895847 RepID=UPI00261914FF|nr:terminase [Sphingomonas bacterium]MDB5706410.1 terminase [Sphingomonas bacterium]